MHLPSSPALLVSGLPRAIGRTPEDSAVLVGLTPAAPHAALIVGAELDDDPAATADLLLRTARQDGAETVACVIYADDAADPSSWGGQTAAAVMLRAEHHGLEAVDALWVSADRWASYLCTNPSCCPPEGSPIPTPEGDTP